MHLFRFWINEPNNRDLCIAVVSQFVIGFVELVIVRNDFNDESRFLISRSGGKQLKRREVGNVGTPVSGAESGINFGQ